jgi:hypothetical protein
MKKIEEYTNSLIQAEAQGIPVDWKSGALQIARLSLAREEETVTQIETLKEAVLVRDKRIQELED